MLAAAGSLLTLAAACCRLLLLPLCCAGLQGRGHLEFVAPLAGRLPCRRGLVEDLCGSLEAAGFVVQVGGWAEWVGAVALAAWYTGGCCCCSSPVWPPILCVLNGASYWLCVLMVRHYVPAVRAVVQEAGLAEAEEALAANQLCGTRLLDSQQLLAAAALEQQEQRQEQQYAVRAAAVATAR